MRRLRNNSELNGPEEYYRMFNERKGTPDYMDMKRWRALLKGFKGGSLLDIGCLDSMVPFLAKQSHPDSQVWALDQAKDVIEELANTYPEINYVSGDCYETEFPNEYFDYIVAGELIEHLDDPKRFVDEAFRILKPNGTLALTTPKEETEAGEVDGLRHLWSFTKEDIRELAQNHISHALIKEIPNWLERRFKYHHPYLIAWLTKK